MTPDPVDLLTEALQRRSVLDIHRSDVMDSLNILRHHGLEVVRFAVDVDSAPGHGVTVERWPGDDSHKRPRPADHDATEQWPPAEEQITVLMAQLARSLDEARAARDRHVQARKGAEQ